MRLEIIQTLENFSINESSIPWPKEPNGELIFGNYQALNEDFIVDFDKFVTDTKKYYGQKAARCIIHDFNMRVHYGLDHGLGIAVDFHFYGLNLYHTIMAALEWGYQKVFFYPEWNHPGVHISYVYEGEGILLGFGKYVTVKKNGKTKTEQQMITNTHNPQLVRERLLDVA